MNTKTLKWIKGILANDEYSTDEELMELFTKQSGAALSHEQAEGWIAKRDFYSNNIVMQDEDGNDTGIYDPKTRSVKPVAA